MILYRQYRPAFFEGFENIEGVADDTDELLATNFIARWGEHPGFHRFSLSHENQEPPFNLMAEYNEGKEWWVVALLWPEHNNELTLPDWEPRRDEQG